jgi:hypothetical protein
MRLRLGGGRGRRLRCLLGRTSSNLGVSLDPEDHRAQGIGRGGNRFLMNDVALGDVCEEVEFGIEIQPGAILLG